MGIRNLNREVIERLHSKTLDARFTTEIQQGLNCSPFESEAVLDVVKEVYFPFLSAEASRLSPGKISLIAVAADEPAGKPVADCRSRPSASPCIGARIDDLLIQQHGPAGFRQARILDLCQQALSQGALLTAEDLAYRVFFVTPRTISRDLIAVRQAHPDVLIPMRSTLHDLGRSSPIAPKSSALHSRARPRRRSARSCTTLPKRSPTICPPSRAALSSPTRRCRSGQIAFLLRRGPRSIKAYLEILAECKRDRNMAYHLDELLRIGSCGGEKKITRGRSAHE